MVTTHYRVLCFVKKCSSIFCEDTLVRITLECFFCRDTYNCDKMSSVKNLAQVVFKSSLEAVRSDKLTVNALQRTGDMLRVGGHEYQLQNNVKVIGFGKAVYGKVPLVLVSLC